MTDKSKGKQPYIPLYIGDWEQDTNTISLEAEAALLKLVFKLWKSDDKGLLEISYPQIAILLKKSEEITIKILQELHENKVLNIEFLPDQKLKIESRRMTKEVQLSKARKEIGSLGGKKKETNKNKKATKSLPKSYQIAEYDIDNEYENSKNKKPPEIILTEPEINAAEEIANSHSWQEQISMRQKIPLELVREKLFEFLNKESLKAESLKRPLNEIKDHFINWIIKNKPNADTAFKQPTANDKRASVHALVNELRSRNQTNNGNNGT